MPDEEREEKKSEVLIAALAPLAPQNPGGAFGVKVVGYGLRDLDLNHGNRSCTMIQAPREAFE